MEMKSKFLSAREVHGGVGAWFIGQTLEKVEIEVTSCLNEMS